jgi:hypothetical protein
VCLDACLWCSGWKPLRGRLARVAVTAMGLDTPDARRRR